MGIFTNTTKTAAKTVDSIMSAFTQTISDLQGVELARINAAEQKTLEAEALMNQAQADTEEAQRASAIAAKLRAIVEA